ncbi:13265_t:CDS:2 [Dentiscutata heterogama]|uniref:13265_t:CDS:1 n=1 Tax=Dentiscutata heterogama TaxID=1316150 RepID=A0ACA9LBG5_9GLOM|nr:13265_t:CDS:2 [Dentiscutata heterogama]
MVIEPKIAKFGLPGKAYDVADNKAIFEFASMTPDCYVELAKKCMNERPSERPIAREKNKIELVDENQKELEDESLLKIKSEFLKADKIIPALSTTLTTLHYRDAIYMRSQHNSYEIRFNLEVP